MNNYVKLLWICIVIMLVLIAARLVQRFEKPTSIHNVEDVLINKSLPALDETKKEIFREPEPAMPDESASEAY